MPPSLWSDSVADTFSNNGSESVYTPPGSNEHMSSPSERRGSDLDQIMDKMTELSNMFGVSVHTPRVQASPPEAMKYAVAIKNTISTFEAALDGMQFSTPGTESFHAYLERHLQRMRSSFDMARDWSLVPHKYLDHKGHFSGLSHKPSAIISRETQINDSASMLHGKLPAAGNNNGRATKTSTPLQTESRNIEELTNADFNSLNLDEKARVILSLLMDSHDVSATSASHPEEATLPGNHLRTRHGVSSMDQNRMQEGKENGRSPTKALDDVLHKISERAVGKMPVPWSGITAGDPGTQFTLISGKSVDAATGRDPDRIAKTFDNTVPKLPTFGQLCKQMREQCTIHSNVSDKQSPGLDSSMPNDLEQSRCESLQADETSLPEDRICNGQGPDQDMPDWFEDMVRVGNSELRIGDPPSSVWHSRKESRHWGGQDHRARGESPARADFHHPHTATWSDVFKSGDDDGLKVARAQYDFRSPHPMTAPRPHEDNVADIENWNQSYVRFLEHSADFLAKGKQPPFKPQTLNFINKLNADKSKQILIVKDETFETFASERLAGVLKKAAEPRPYVSLSSTDGMVRESTNPVHDKHLYVDDAVSDESVGTPVSSPNWSFTERGSSRSAQETAVFDNSGSSDNCSAKEPSLRCDSCGSVHVFSSYEGVNCFNCGIFTERPIPHHVESHKLVNDPKEVKNAALNQATALPTVSSNTHEASKPWLMAFTEDTDVSVTADHGWDPPHKEDSGAAAGWGLPLEHDADAWGAPSTVEFQTTPGLVAGWKSPAPSIADEDHVWTKTQDQYLLDQKATYPSRSWAHIANEMGLPVSMCKARFEVIKPAQSKPKLTKKQKKQLKKNQSPKVQVSAGTAPKFDPSAFGSSIKGHDDEMRNINRTTLGGGDTSIDAAPWGSDDRAPPISTGDDDVCWGGGRCEGSGSPVYGPWGGFQSKRSLSPTDLTPSMFDTTSEPADPAPKDYIVTYWATVECDNETVHIPIKDGNISGPEKTVLEGPAKKVWKWVQDKGLGDMVGLQDAFDLAKDLHGDDEKEASASFNLPKPSYPPSLRRSRSPFCAKEPQVKRCQACRWGFEPCDSCIRRAQTEWEG